jgi:Cation transport ATPase
MSVIVKDADHKIWLYCKGADSILLERMDRAKNPEIDDTQRHLSTFADEGLRTLLVCKKEIPRAEYDAWFKRYLVKRFLLCI